MGGNFCSIDNQPNLTNYQDADELSQQPLLTAVVRTKWAEWLHTDFFDKISHTIYASCPLHSCWKQIEKDVMRTFPEEPFFGKSENILRFQTLLSRFAAVFPRVGYTQGLNFLAGYILLCGYDDKEAITMLVSLCSHPQLLLIGLFQDNFPLEEAYTASLLNMLEKREPELSAKINGLLLPKELWLFQWLVTFFLYSFPVRQVKYFWQFVLTQKELAVPRIAFGILQQLKTEIMNVNDQNGFLLLMASLKDKDVFNELIDSSAVLRHASSVSESWLKVVINPTKQHINFFINYFSHSPRDTERSEFYVKLQKKWLFEHNRFLRNPNAAVFTELRKSSAKLEDSISEQLRSLSLSYLNSTNSFNNTFTLAFLRKSLVRERKQTERKQKQGVIKRTRPLRN